VTAEQNLWRLLAQPQPAICMWWGNLHRRGGVRRRVHGGRKVETGRASRKCRSTCGSGSAYIVSATGTGFWPRISILNLKLQYGCGTRGAIICGEEGARYADCRTYLATGTALVNAESHRTRNCTVQYRLYRVKKRKHIAYSIVHNVQQFTHFSEGLRSTVQYKALLEQSRAQHTVRAQGKGRCGRCSSTTPSVLPRPRRALVELFC